MIPTGVLERASGLEYWTDIFLILDMFWLVDLIMLLNKEPLVNL